MSPLTRRRLLASAGLGAAGVGLGAGGHLAGQEAGEAKAEGTGTVPFFGEHQAGIATPAQPDGDEGRDRQHPRRGAEAMRRFVWLGAGDGPAWMRGGSFQVARRIRMLLETWDRTSLEDQERTIGRHKYSGAALGERGEFDPLDLDAETDGEPTIPADSHVRLASPQENDGQRILRRGYSFTGGVDESLGSMDALNEYVKHVGSAVFAVPPGARPGAYVGETLLG
ncbi:MAG TPA: Dyp-type peroxidase [Solirubrobacterales bacterium]